MKPVRPKALVKHQHLLQDTWTFSPFLAQAMPRLETNTRLSAHLRELMPSTLKAGWRAHISGTTLHMTVPHQALAVKLKQQAPLFLDGLRMFGWDVNDMVVKVSKFNRPEWLNRTPNKPKIINTRHISARSAAHIQQLLADLSEDDPIYPTLIKLLRHQKS